MFKVDDGMLKVLDELERHPIFYNRRLMKIQLMCVNRETLSNNNMFEEGNTLECLCYVMPNFKDELLTLTMEDDYDANRHAYVPKVKRTMTRAEQRDHIFTNVRK